MPTMARPKKQKSQQTENAPAEISSDSATTETSTINNPVNQENGETKKMENITLRVTTTVMSLENMDDVLLAKEEVFEAPTTIAEAEARLGNDTAKLLKVIIAGLQDLRKTELKKDKNIPWRTVTDKGELNGPFAGEMVDSKKMGGLVLQFAKLNGYSDTKVTAERKKIKTDAEDLVKSLVQTNKKIRESVTTSFGEDEESDELTASAQTEGTETPETAIQ